MDLVISCTCILVHACTHVFWIVVLRMRMLSQAYYKVKNKNIQRDPLENTQIHVQNVRRIEVSQDRDELRKILGWNWPGGRSFFKVEYWSGVLFQRYFFLNWDQKSWSFIPGVIFSIPLIFFYFLYSKWPFWKLTTTTKFWTFRLNWNLIAQSDLNKFIYT